jgi:adenylylsulfate kinase-like enzyme
MTKTIIGEDYFEVFVDTPLEICEKRDVKGLYAKARKGEIRGFTGIDAPFESPENPELILKTENKSVEACTKELFDHIIEKINP